MKRHLYIVSYDIRCPKRLSSALKVIRDFAGGGQYSCYECYLSREEKLELIERMAEVMKDTDGLFLMPLQSKQDVLLLGAAIAPLDGDIYIVS